MSNPKPLVPPAPRPHSNACRRRCHAAAWALVVALTSASAAPLQEVVVVFKTHFDIGYTDLASNVVQRYRTAMIDEALAVVDQNRSLPPERQFVWTLPGWPSSQILADWPGQEPERRQRVQAAFREGRFVVHALPFTTHTELLEPEELVRGLQFSSRLARENGLSLPRDAKMTDVPSHSWLMPTLLVRAGVSFLHLGCNAASSSPNVPLLFWWEGPDGARLLTMYTAESYGTGLRPPPDWPHKTWLALIHTGDNHGPPRPEEVRALLEQAARELPGVRVRIGRLSDFSDAILAEQPALPVVRGDMPDTWIHGPMSDPQGAARARNLRPLLTATEALTSLLPLWGEAGAAPEATSVLAKAFEQSLLYGEHTWGGALYWVTPYGANTRWAYGETWKADRAAGRFDRLETSWAEHSTYIQNAQDLLRPMLARQLQTLARSVAVPGPRLVVFNPLPWARSGPVQVHEAAFRVPAVRPAGHRSILPIASSAPSPVFSAPEIRPLGYATFTPAQPGPPTRPGSTTPHQIENRFLRVRVDPEGHRITSVFDKVGGRELVESGAPQGFGQFLYERFDSNQVATFVRDYVKIDADWAVNELGKPSLPTAATVPYSANVPGPASLEREDNEVFSALTLRSQSNPQVPFPVTTRVVLYARQPWLDLEVTLHGKPADPWPEAGWICLPFNIEAPRFRVGRQASIIDPTGDIVAGANRHLWAVHTGVAMLDRANRGAAFCPIDSPLVSLGEPGLWKYSRDYVPRTARAYVNLFNNQWTTNFRLWNEGTITSRIRVWPFARYSGEESLVRPALEARFPLLVASMEGPAGRLPPSQSGLRVDRSGVLVTAFGPNPNGPGTLLRLWELAGYGGRCRVQLPVSLRSGLAQPVDLRGQPLGEPRSIRKGVLDLTVEPFAPVSMVLLP